MPLWYDPKKQKSGGKGGNAGGDESTWMNPAAIPPGPDPIGGRPTEEQTLLNGIDFPLDIFPWSQSWGTQYSEGNQKSSSSSKSNSQSKTGLPNWASNLIQGAAESWFPKAMEAQGGLMESYLSPENYLSRFKPTQEAIVNEMNRRGLLGGDIMAKNIAEKAMEQYSKDQALGLAAYQNLLNSITQALLGTRAATSTSKSQSLQEALGKTLAGGETGSYWEDPTQMYQILSNLIMGTTQ